MRPVDELALAAWRLGEGDHVDVDLLVVETKNATAGTVGPVTVSGKVGRSSNATVLVLIAPGTERLTRVPWAAIAAVRLSQTPAPPHPGL